ncbi:BTB domain-containing protein [Favolaschia claudopus]|uniref:BTB domain-containing protein n=1 Tax=Favolaschia claudopus TaxID=2862362 RepID=A0AAW0DBM4_9AGAR
MSEQPQKRQRTERNAPDAEPVYKQSEQVWMTYGDIIIQVQDMQFKVNRDVLARNSVVFAGMLDIPQPVEQAQVDGLPVVQLVGDSPKEVESLLAAFYDPFYRTGSISFDALAFSLRLGRKYEAVTFKHDAAKRLHSEFPNTLDRWDKRQARQRLHGMESIRHSATIYVDLLSLAWENGVYTSVPALGLHCLSTYTLNELYDGLLREDGSRATLPEDVQLMLARGQEHIQIFQRNMFEWLREEGEVVPNQNECVLYDDCEEQRQAMFKIECGENRVDISFFLEQWEKLAGGDWAGRICVDCNKAAKVAHDVQRAAAWEKLPLFFGLPAWNDLKDRD